MYLIELSADVQILEMYTNKYLTKKLSPLEELDQLRKDPLKYKEIMTIEIANWITKYLKLSEREYINEVIERVSSCCVVEEAAYEIIDTWQQYRTDKDLKFFAFYRALFFIEDDSIEILNEIFHNENYLHLKSLIKSRLELESVTPSFMSNILIPIIQGAHRISMHTSACICSREILDLLLSMERERILSNQYKSPEISNRSYLSVIRSCSINIQHHLIQHLQDFNRENQFENSIKEQYLIAIIKWIVLQSIDDIISEEVYEGIITFVQDQKIPLVQMIIVNGINGILINKKANKGHVFLKDDLKKQLEDIIEKINISREDLLTACLLTYGSCLLKFNNLEINQNVSIEIQNLLERIYLISSSEIISARALLCLLFSRNGNVRFQNTSDWIKNNLNFPAEKRFNVLLQLTLYEHPSLYLPVQNAIKNHMEAYSSILLDNFLIALYNDLCNKDSEDIFFEYTPDYVEIAWTVRIPKSDMVFDALRRTSFGEKKFKTALCQASRKRSNIWYLGFYAAFGEITEEFVEILTNVGEIWKSRPGFLSFNCREIKNVSGRIDIEKLFELFQLKFHSKSIFSIRILELLVCLAQQGFISTLDIYHQVSIVTNNGLYEYDKTIFNTDNDPFLCLLELRKFGGRKDRVKDVTFLTMENIENNFKKIIQSTDKDSSLLFQREPFSQ